MGAPLYSWRLEVSDYLAAIRGDGDLTPLFDQKNAAWNSPRNLQASQEEGNPFGYVSWDPDTTKIFAITGPGAAFDDAGKLHFWDLPSNVIVLMEAADSKTYWTEPGDYDATELLSYSGRIGDHLHGLLPDRLHVLFADGEVWALSPDAPIDALQPFLTIAGAESHDRKALLGPHRVR
jgi:hypothetical protein